MVMSELGIPLKQLIDAWLQACAEENQYPDKDGWTPTEIITDFYQWLKDDVEDYDTSLQPGTWLCVVPVLQPNRVDQDFKVFTEGRLYEGELSSALDEPAILFTDDSGHPHLAYGTWLHAHFKFQPVIDVEVIEIGQSQEVSLPGEEITRRTKAIDRLRSESAWGLLAARALNEEGESGDD